MTMDEFNRKGGALGGKERVHTENDGCPAGAHGGTEGRGLRQTASSSSSSSNEVSDTAAMGGMMWKEKKPSLMDRLNPMKDADGDGKKGFMS